LLSAGISNIIKEWRRRMIELNMLGKACPIPMIEARKAIQALGSESDIISVTVDNEIACENIKKMADGLKLKSVYRKAAEGQYVMEITVGEGEVLSTQEKTVSVSKEKMPGEGIVVSIGQNTMGKGEEELGRILIKGFIYSLTELETVPSYVLFFNSGAKLVCEGSNTVEDIKKLEELGVKVLVCGTCVDYYGLKEKVQVGEITNMYGIVTALSNGDQVINI
jgi:selenium metabolism protein YedF